MIPPFASSFSIFRYNTEFRIIGIQAKAILNLNQTGMLCRRHKDCIINFIIIVLLYNCDQGYVIQKDNLIFAEHIYHASITYEAVHTERCPVELCSFKKNILCVE